MEFSRDFTETILSLSTAHIMPQTNAALVDRLPALLEALTFDATDQGFLIRPHTFEEVKAAGFGELAHLMRLATVRGDTWLRLDADADIHDDLPTWEW